MTQAGYRPYASPTAVMGVLRKLRRRIVPEQVTVKYIRSLGLSGPMASRVFKALRFLGLVGAYGETQQVLRSLASSKSDAEYRETLAGVIRQAYRDIFRAADPSATTQEDIELAFGQYDPGSQPYRMTVLFLGLCRAAGIPVQPQLRLPQSSVEIESRTAGSSAARTRKSPRRKKEVAAALESDFILSFFRRLPALGSAFSRREQEAWLEGMKGALRLEYPVDDEEPGSGDRP